MRQAIQEDFGIVTIVTIANKAPTVEVAKACAYLVASVSLFLPAVSMNLWQRI